MKLSNELRYVLYQLAVATLFGCLLFVLAGCDNRPPSNGSLDEKVNHVMHGSSVAADQVAAKIYQGTGDSRQSAQFNPESHGAGNGTAALDDSAITRSVKTALRRDPRLDPFSVIVETVNGEVTLKGEIISSDLRQHTENVAASVAGVARVNNLIRITWNK